MDSLASLVPPWDCPWLWDCQLVHRLCDHPLYPWDLVLGESLGLICALIVGLNWLDNWILNSLIIVLVVVPVVVPV